MNDNNWTKKELEFSRQLKKIYDEDVTEIPSLDTNFMKYTSAKKLYKKKLSRAVNIAAIIVLIVISSIVTAIGISKGYVEAFKDGIVKEIFSWRSGVTVTDDTTSVDEQNEIWEISDPELAYELSDIFSEIKSPEYIPDKYEFETVKVEHSANNDYTAIFQYSNGTDILRIMQIPVFENDTVGSNSDGEIIELSDRIIAVWDDFDSETHGCTVIFNDVSVQISTNELSEDDILKIAKELK